jgi:hypothetical protein
MLDSVFGIYENNLWLHLALLSDIVCDKGISCDDDQVTRTHQMGRSTIDANVTRTFFTGDGIGL